MSGGAAAAGGARPEVQRPDDDLLPEEGEDKDLHDPCPEKYDYARDKRDREDCASPKTTRRNITDYEFKALARG